jgi:hypothetical protein
MSEVEVIELTSKITPNILGSSPFTLLVEGTSLPCDLVALSSPLTETLPLVSEIILEDV